MRHACLDVGSTFTKALLVDGSSGAVVSAASVPTTSSSDVLEGVEAALRGLGVPVEQGWVTGVGDVRVCSSAGGGLRLAVVGYERVVTAEAGRRAALSAGARVVEVVAGELGAEGVRALRAAAPDLLLLVGGTDGGNAGVLLRNAAALAESRWATPVVVAGNAEAVPAAAGLLGSLGVTVLVAANVLPEIGRLDPEPARSVIRTAFVEHVIGGKGLTRDPERFRGLVRAATPDAVLGGAELVAAATADVLVVDVGGATTDVYSVLDTAGGERSTQEGRRGDVAGDPAALRTVEGDLGVRWSAPGVVEAAVGERLLDGPSARTLAAAAAQRQADPGLVPASADERSADLELARLAITVAVRRHARTGRDLRRVAVVVGSGGVLRRASARERASVLEPLLADHGGGWRVPEHARIVVDGAGVLSAAGLLASDAPRAADALGRGVLRGGLGGETRG